MCTRTFPYIDRTDESLFQNVEIITANDDNPVVAQKIFLIYASGKFLQLVNEEARNNQICIPHISKSIMEVLVNYVYSTYSENPSNIDITDENVLDLSKSSKYLQLNDVIEMCRVWIDAKEIKSENCALLLQSALILYSEEDEQHHVKNILDFLVKNICQVSLTEQFESLPFSLIHYILEYNKSFHAVSEKTMTVAIVNWLKDGKKSYSMNKDLVQAFTSKENQITILTAFFEQGDNEKRHAAFQTLKALYLEDASEIVKTESPDTSFSSSSSGYNSTTSIKEEQQGDDEEIDSSSMHSSAKRPRLDSTSESKSDNIENDIMKPCVQDSQNSNFVKEPQPGSSSKVSKVQINRSNDKKRHPGMIYFLHGDMNIVGGQRQLWSYNLRTQNFKRVANLQQPLSLLRKLSLLYWNGRIYFLGGEVAYTGVVTSSVVVFNIKRKTWKELKSMSSPRYEFQSVIFDQSIYAVGGNQEDTGGPELPGITMNGVEKLPLNAKNRRWEEATDYMNKARADAGIVVLCGKIYAIGGLCGSEEATTSSECECYDPSLPVDNQWTNISKMNIPRIGLAAVVCNDRIYAIGGRKSELETIGFRFVEIYNPETDQWTQGPNLVNGRHNFSAVVHEGNIFAIGGDSQDLPTIEKLDLQSNKWEIIGNMKLYGDYSSIAFQQNT